MRETKIPQQDFELKMPGGAYAQGGAYLRDTIYMYVLKVEPPGMYLATMAYVYAACTVCVTIFHTGGKVQLVSNFTDPSYTLLLRPLFLIN